jgi:hypothetical protein
VTAGLADRHAGDEDARAFEQAALDRRLHPVVGAAVSRTEVKPRISIARADTDPLAASSVSGMPSRNGCSPPASGVDVASISPASACGRAGRRASPSRR